MGAFAGLNRTGNDFYEPRMPGLFFKSPRFWKFNVWTESNSAKKYYITANYFTSLSSLFGGRGQEFYVSQRYRFNDKFSLSNDIDFVPYRNDAGFYSIANNNVLFSRRDRKTVENILKAKYNFNNRSGITFRARHYWSKVEAKELFDLKSDGTLLPTTQTGVAMENQNLNFFNIDAVYTLQFAPGSFINIVWKNAIFTDDNPIQYRYFKNFDRTIDAPQNNNLSVKILYYLDYLDFKKWRSRKQGN